MSFVPAPQASAANAASANNAQVTTPAAAAPAADGDADKDLLFKIRTFDVYWVDKTALMCKDGFDKVSVANDPLWIQIYYILEDRSAK